MRFPRLGRGWWSASGALLAALALTLGCPGVPAGGLLSAPDAGVSWPRELPLAALAALGLAVPYRMFALGGRLGALRRRLDGLHLPAAASGVSGRVIFANPPMLAACGAAGTDLARMLARGFDVDPSVVYRLSVAARRIGFGFEPARARSDGAEMFLVSRHLEPDIVVWTVTPSDRMPRVALSGAASPYETAPFAHLRVSDSGSVTVNEVYRRRYGEPGALPPELGTGGGPAGRRLALLTGRGGATELVSVRTFPGHEDGEDFRDIIILPVQGGEGGPGAQAVLDALPVALMQLDPAGRLLWSNAQAREMVGRDLRPGMALSDIVAPLGRPVDALLSDSGAPSGSRREMVRLRGSAHDTFLHVSLTPVTLDGTPGLLAVLSDASELRLLEDKFAQSQKMEAVGKLAGGVAHDFNNVLTAISGHADLLLLGKDALHPDYSDLVQIRQNTHRAAALVRQLLAFSRKQTLKPELLSVQDIVSDTQYLLSRLIGEKVSLAVDHGAELWMVRADQQQIEQALMNLVVNARDAMPDGGTVTIATRNVALDEHYESQDIEVPVGRYVQISVTDSGTGIALPDLDRIFEPFFTTKARGEGTGLGLSTVYGIVKQSGGFIFADNRPGGGARFRILLPRASAETAEDAIRISRPQGEPRGRLDSQARDQAGGQPGGQPGVQSAPDRPDLTGSGVVLLVEDEDPVRSFASRALRLRGYEVVEAASAEQAMAFLSDPANQVDVLVSDVVMPGMDGPTFAVAARDMRPGLRVIFISGYAEDSLGRDLMDSDFLFLSKPFSLADLTAKVKEALGRAA